MVFLHLLVDWESRFLALSSHSVRPLSTKVTSYQFSTIWPSRPYTPSIFWKLMTSTIYWPTNHSPMTLSDPQDPPRTHPIDLLSTTKQFNVNVYEHICLLANFTRAPLTISLPESPDYHNHQIHQNHQIQQIGRFTKIAINRSYCQALTWKQWIDKSLKFNSW